MAYDESALNPIDPTSLTWAVAFLRMLLRDTQEPLEHADAELSATLALQAFQVGGTAYYRPHMTAAAMVRSDPERAIIERVDNVSVHKQDPAVIASQLEKAWASIDDQIAGLAGQRPPVGRTFRPVF